jgi:hypothetical protein
MYSSNRYWSTLYEAQVVIRKKIRLSLNVGVDLVFRYSFVYYPNLYLCTVICYSIKQFKKCVGEPVIEEVEDEDDILGKQEGDNDINEDDIEAVDVGDSVQITEISEPDTPYS